MDICLKVIDPFGEVYLGTYRGLRQITWSFQSSTVELGQWIIQASALFEGDRCSATVDNFCSDCDNPRWRVYVIVEAPAVCGDGVVDDGEACDYEGYQCVGQSHTTTIFRDMHGTQITRYVGGMSCENCAETVENTSYTSVPHARYVTSAYYLDTQSAGDFRCAHLSFCAAGQTPVEAGYRTCSLPE